MAFWGKKKKNKNQAEIEPEALETPMDTDEGEKSPDSNDVPEAEAAVQEQPEPEAAEPVEPAADIEDDAAPEPQTEAASDAGPDSPDESAPEAEAEPQPEKKKLGFWARRRQRLAAEVAAGGEVKPQPAPPQPEEEAAEPELEAPDGPETQVEPEAPKEETGPEPSPGPELEEPEPPEPAEAPYEPPREHQPQAEPEPESGPAEEPEPETDEAPEQLEPQPEELAEDQAAAEPIESDPKADEESGQDAGEPATAEEESPEDSERKGFISRIFQRLGKTRSKIGGSIERITLGKKIDDEVLDELEEVLITADLGMETTLDLIDGLRGKVRRKELNDAQALKEALKSGIQEAMAKAPAPAPREHKPHVILMVGVNGVGKTTTIGKLASYFSSQGQKVMLAAGDTFRAAAAEQLGIWAERTGSLFVRQKEGADPSAVAYSAVESALSKEVDIVLVDTAGRLHTKVNLMEELKKIHRVIGKKYPGAPHEVLLVLDATTGQNAMSQAKMFNQSVPLNGVVLTKLDGTAKGGIVVAISSELKLPVCFVGLGESVDDLRPFNPEEFADALF